MSQVSRQSEVAYINSAPSTPGYLLALLRELSQCPWALAVITKSKQVQKMNLTSILYQFKKKGWRIDPHVSNIRSREFFFQDP